MKNRLHGHYVMDVYGLFLENISFTLKLIFNGIKIEDWFFFGLSLLFSFLQLNRLFTSSS